MSEKRSSNEEEVEEGEGWVGGGWVADNSRRSKKARKGNGASVMHEGLPFRCSN